MNKPNVTQVHSPNYTSGRTGNKVIAIVEHIMDGTLEGTDSWFADPSSQVSAHFGVGKNGEIHQYVDIDNEAWANGVVAKPSWPLLIPNANPNSYTVSIEHEGHRGDVLTEAQYQATLSLQRWLIAEFGIVPNTDTIIGHNRIDGVDRANCPGAGFPWNRLFKDLAGGAGMPYLILKQGSQGAEVQDLQASLLKLGYSQIGSADGDFGAHTFVGVTRFQADHGLGADGVVGQQTWDAIDKAITLLTPPTQAPVTVAKTTDPDPDVYLSVRVRTSKADAVIAQIIAMGYACKPLHLA